MKVSMTKEHVRYKLEEFDKLLTQKSSGIQIDKCYDYPEFFINQLTWMHKFKHIDDETFDKFLVKVNFVFKMFTIC